jgi:hypothetical protein
MLKRLGAATAIAMATATGASAQTPAVSTGELQMGDRWTYASRDEITGQDLPIFTHTVTDVTPTEIGIRLTKPGRPNGYITYDRAWNMTSNGPWRYTPNNGMGIKEPLTVGMAWKVKASETNSTNNASWNRSGDVKVLAQENITTKAGTFDTFEIESTFEDRDNNDATKKLQAVQRMWYAPMVNHWIKQTLEVRMGGTLRQNTSVEVIDYGRRD